MSSGKLTAITAGLLLSVALVNVARADVEITNKPTANMSCDAGVCTATAQKAVLNVTDLATMLASGDVAVKTSTLAKDIDIDQPLTWSSTSRLTLDAQQSVTVKKQITVAGHGALTVVTNDTGAPKNRAGEFIIVPERGSVQFWDLGSSLIIDSNSYTLVDDIKTLASDIAANPSGFYAVAKPYDASVDGTYTSSPVQTTFSGTLDGLGNPISNLTIKFAATQNGAIIGFLDTIGPAGAARHLALANSILEGTTTLGIYGSIGPIAGYNQGLIEGAWASGTISLPGGASAQAGGLAGDNKGIIIACYAVAKLSIRSGGSNVAGLVGSNRGSVVRSYAKGSVNGDKGDVTSQVGGVAGYNSGIVANAFALNSVHRANGCCESLGGLVGKNDVNGIIQTSYAAGKVMLGRRGNGFLGGLVGYDGSPNGNMQNTYWDLDRGLGDPSQGAGNIQNDPGITGLTTVQLQSSLPQGFDPKIWTENAKVNGGFPYLSGVTTK